MVAWQKIWSYILPPALALGLVLLLRLTVLSVVRVYSSALSPQINPGAIVFVSHLSDLDEGSAVLFRLKATNREDELALGRISRMSSDSLGQPCYWVLSDDTLQHPDSRDLGWIAHPDVVGTVVYHIDY